MKQELNKNQEFQTDKAEGTTQPSVGGVSGTSRNKSHKGWLLALIAVAVIGIICIAL